MAVRRRTVRGALAAAALVLVVTGGCGADEPTAEPAGPDEPTSAAVETTQPADGSVIAPVLVARLPALLTGFAAMPGDDELLVADRRGLVWRLDASEGEVPVLEPEPLLDLSSEISLLGERGMLGLEATPDGTGLVVDYTALDGTITVELFPYEGGGPIDRAEGRVLVALPHPYSWHHGGDLAFDEAGDLFVSVGDMELRQLDPPGPQDPELVLGGVLRVPAAAVEGTDRSWVAGPGDMVARGMRNPWRLSFDPTTGDLWIGDVGLDSVEEVDLIPADALATQVTNFGWPYFEGEQAHQGTPPEGLVVEPPVHVRTHAEDVCGIVGGFVARGDAVPALAGRYVYGDLCSPEIRAFTVGEGPPSDDAVVGTASETLISLGESRDGRLWALGAGGGLFRLDPATDPGAGSEQVPADPGPTTTTVPRTAQTCDQMVGAVLPLSEIGSLGPSQLEATLAQVNQRVTEVIPTLPDSIRPDALVVQASLLELTTRLEAIGYANTGGQVEDLRDEIQRGEGAFEGFPDAMARIVDAECG